MPQNFEFAALGEAQGASRTDQDKLTWICKQALLGRWELPDSNTLPTGVILDSILLTSCTEPYRLEDMCLHEPATSLRTHTVWVQGGRR